jgi:hypothetical protein
MYVCVYVYVSIATSYGLDDRGVGVRVPLWSRIFLTSALVGGEWSATRPCRFTSRGKSPRYPLDRRLGVPEPVWSTWRKENSRPFRYLKSNPFSRPARSQSLYRPRYLGSLKKLRAYVITFHTKHRDISQIVQNLNIRAQIV